MLNFSEKGTDAGLMIVAEQGKWLPPESVDFSVQDGYVTIDTRKLHQQRPNAVVFFKFRNLPMSEILPGKNSSASSILPVFRKAVRFISFWKAANVSTEKISTPGFRGR